MAMAARIASMSGFLVKCARLGPRRSLLGSGPAIARTKLWFSGNASAPARVARVHRIYCMEEIPMRAWKYALLIPLAVGLLTAAYDRTHTDHLMVDAAKNYLVSLNPDQRKLTSFALDNMDERTHWLYTPFLRHGLTLREMTQTQRNLAEALVAAGLSSQGLVKAHTIMSLEEILFIAEKDGDMERDPGKYFVSIFGEPSEHGTWGYRFEGHHVSLNYTIVDGKIASSPSFFGSNPAKILEGRRKGLRALAREDDLGYKLIESLTGEQRAIAVVDK